MVTKRHDSASFFDLALPDYPAVEELGRPEDHVRKDTHHGQRDSAKNWGRMARIS